MSGQFDEARRFFETAIKKNKYDVSSRIGAVLIDIQEGRRSEAQNKIDQLVKDFPEDASVMETAAYYFLRIGDYPNAAGLSMQILGGNPFNLTARTAIAFALAAGGEPAEGYKVGKQISEQLPKQPTGHIIMARALMAQGKFAEARAEAEKAKRLSLFDNRDWALMSPSKLIEEIDLKSR